MAATLQGTALVHDEVVPAASFTEAPGCRRRSLADWRQRKSLVLCFLHDECERCTEFASALTALASDIALADAEVRVVAGRPDPLPFPVLVDDGLCATRRLLGDEGRRPTILVLDRYGAAWESWPASEHDFPPAGEVVDTLTSLSMICHDCD